MADPKTIKISKLDAARRQLRTAITLWFNNGDPVATHALAFASYEILHAISKKRDPKRQPLLFDSSFIREEIRSTFNIAMKKRAYFFKHGDRDPEAIIEFNPTISDGFILFSIFALELCGERRGHEEEAFILWMQINAPELLVDAEGKPFVNRLPVDAVNQIREIAKSDFLEMYKLAQARQGC